MENKEKVEIKKRDGLKERFNKANQQLKKDWNQAKGEFSEDFKNMKADLKNSPTSEKPKGKPEKKSEKNGFIILLEALWLLVMSAPIFLIGILALVFGLFLVWELIKSIF